MHGENPGEEIRKASARSQTMKNPVYTAKNFYSILWTIRELLKFCNRGSDIIRPITNSKGEFNGSREIGYSR